MRLFLFILFTLLFFSGCATVKFHDYAEFDPDKAEKLIKQLKNDTLLVVFPTYQEKEKIVRSALKKHPNSKKKLWKDLEDIKKEREININFIETTFDENFTFCQYLLIPDSLVSDFEDGLEGAFFLGSGNKLDPNIKLQNRKPFKLLHRTDVHWDFRIENELLPNPFPNYITYRNGLLELLGLEDFGDIFKKVTYSLQRRLDQFYNNPRRAVRY